MWGSVCGSLWVGLEVLQCLWLAGVVRGAFASSDQGLITSGCACMVHGHGDSGAKVWVGLARSLWQLELKLVLGERRVAWGYLRLICASVELLSNGQASHAESSGGMPLVSSLIVV